MNSPADTIDAAIHRAASATGVSAQFLRNVAFRESSMNPEARAATSSAAGLFQFIEETWLRTLATHGRDHGLAKEASQITRTSDGDVVVTDPERRAALLDLRLDPQAAALMAGALTEDNAAALRAGLGRDPSSGEMYIAHVLGAGGAVRLIEAAAQEPGRSAADLFPRAAAANARLFHHPDGREATVDELRTRLEALVDASRERNGGAAQANSVPGAEGSPEPPLLRSPALRAVLAENSDRTVRPVLGHDTPMILSTALVQALASLEAPAAAERDPQERDDRHALRRTP